MNAPEENSREVAEIDFGGHRQAVRDEIEHDGILHEALHRDQHDPTLLRLIPEWWDAGAAKSVYAARAAA